MLQALALISALMLGYVCILVMLSLSLKWASCSERPVGKLLQFRMQHRERIDVTNITKSFILTKRISATHVSSLLLILSVLSSSMCFITLHAKLSGAVYCYRSCLCVCKIKDVMYVCSSE